MVQRRTVERVGVWGRSGSGKSSFVKQAIAGQGRVIVFDPLAEYGAHGFETIRHKSSSDLRLVKKSMLRHWSRFRIAYQPPAANEIAALNALSWLLVELQDEVPERNRKPITLVVEEMNTCFPLHAAGRCPGFAEICSRGRIRNIAIYGASQRIAEVSTRFRGNNNQTVIFAQQGARDIEAAASEAGIDKSLIRDLDDLDYLHEVGRKVTRKKITFTKKS